MITLDDMIRTLEKYTDFHIDKSMLTKYVRDQLVRKPHYIDQRGNNKSARVSYDLLAVAELLTAVSLIHADQIFHISRFSINDIYYGRMQFLCKDRKIIRGERGILEHLVRLYETRVFYKKLNDSTIPTQLFATHKKYCHEIYTSTFIKWYNILKDDKSLKE